MYARLKITEVIEVTRELSIEERCMLFSVAYANNDGCVDKDFRKAAEDRLTEIGFVQYADQQKNLGLFRYNTQERPATEIETIAWHCTQIWKPCDMIGGECFTNCPKKGVCEVVLDYKKSMAILEGKTVSVEYFEE